MSHIESNSFAVVSGVSCLSLFLIFHLQTKYFLVTKKCNVKEITKKNCLSLNCNSNLINLA